ncbi:hypothetical protein LEP1GSC035_0220 [Leptospira noguchii str. 2007001578]|uniref:Uncharacterized protein n=1 Tax=Leptospira noguchii str. 2007001578 TaxID=1049974 RepID=A0ABN0J3X2_9LEPT|nr:hypothetical protein LEP1GSC035_0220 [Leptospira noguchii str. 2007001578]
MVDKLQEVDFLDRKNFLIIQLKKTRFLVLFVFRKCFWLRFFLFLFWGLEKSFWLP